MCEINSKKGNRNCNLQNWYHTGIKEHCYQ